MADTFTAVLSLTKPEVGASLDTWGTKLNDNFDDVDGLFQAGPALKVANGGTAATTASGARTNLGLGTIATQAADAVAITGGTATLSSAILSATAPRLDFYESDAAANAKRWYFVSDGGGLSLRAGNDANDDHDDAIVLLRTGTTIDSIALTATAVTINGNAAFHAGNLSGAAIAETQITDGSVLARVGGNETVTGTWAFTATPGKTGGGKFLHYASSTNSGGAVTVSASAASGTPAAGDIWIQYV